MFSFISFGYFGQSDGPVITVRVILRKPLYFGDFELYFVDCKQITKDVSAVELLEEQNSSHISRVSIQIIRKMKLQTKKANRNTIKKSEWSKNQRACKNWSRRQQTLLWQCYSGSLPFSPKFLLEYILYTTTNIESQWTILSFRIYLDLTLFQKCVLYYNGHKLEIHRNVAQSSYMNRVQQACTTGSHQSLQV